MSDHSAIEWTDATWNPLRGCSRVSAGCQHCYAERVAHRFSGAGQPYEGLVHPSTKGWNGQVRFVPEVLDQPLRWTKPRMIFVNSMSDLFHESVPNEWIDRVFAVMAASSRHTFQVLTKRPERMLAYLRGIEAEGPARLRHYVDVEMADSRAARQALNPPMSEPPDPTPELRALFDRVQDYDWTPPRRFHGVPEKHWRKWPLENVWLGVSVEDQAAADERIPLLLQCPAAVRWLSCEPLLGPIHFRWAPYAHSAAGQTYREYLDAHGRVNEYEALRQVDWVVAGGESGPGARPMHPDWARSLRDQCASAGVPFFFKQWGEWAAPDDIEAFGKAHHGWWEEDRHDGGVPRKDWPGPMVNGIELVTQRDEVFRVGKKAAGRLLDGVEHNAYPVVKS